MSSSHVDRAFSPFVLPFFLFFLRCDYFFLFFFPIYRHTVVVIFSPFQRSMWFSFFADDDSLMKRIWQPVVHFRYPVNDNSVFFLSKSYWPNYHYTIPWDWRNDEFGSYESGFATFMIKIWYEMGLLDNRKTTTSEDVREILEKIVLNNISMTDAFAQLKEKSEEDACKQKLMFYS